MWIAKFSEEGYKHSIEFWEKVSILQGNLFISSYRYSTELIKKCKINFNFQEQSEYFCKKSSFKKYQIEENRFRK